MDCLELMRKIEIAKLMNLCVEKIESFDIKWVIKDDNERERE